MRDEVVSGDVVVGEGGGKGEPAPRQVKGGRQGVHVLGGRQAPSEQAPRVGVAGAMMQGDLCQHHGVRGVAGEDVVCVWVRWRRCGRWRWIGGSHGGW